MCASRMLEEGLRIGIVTGEPESRSAREGVNASHSLMWKALGERVRHHAHKDWPNRRR